MLSSPTDSMILGALSLAGAQEGLSLFSDAPSELCRLIQENPFSNYSFSLGAMEILHTVDFLGYYDSETGLLIPESLLFDEAKEQDSYYHMRFLVHPSP